MPRELLQSGLLIGLLAPLLLLGCGGGGGGGPAVTDLGTLASTVPTIVPVVFQNPLSEPATVTQVSSAGDFSIDPTDLPALAPASDTVTLGLVFLPGGTGLRSGTVTLRFEGATSSQEVASLFQATGESVVFGLNPATAAFGLVDAGIVVDRTVVLDNQSALSPATFQGITLPNPAFSIVGNPFPLTIAPSTGGAITIRFAPTAGGTYDGNAFVGVGDPGGPIQIPLVAASPGGGEEDIVDFGSVSFGVGGLTSQLSVDVPSDAIAFMIEVKGSPNGFYNLGELVGPGNKLYLGTDGSGGYAPVLGLEVFSAQVPNTDKAGLQLVPGGGTYRFRIRRSSGSNAQIGVRVIIERRPGAISDSGVLPLNVWLAQGIAPTAATAATNTRLQQILTIVDDTLAQQGVRLGSINYYDIPDAGFDSVSQGEFSLLLQSTSSVPDVRVNLFFVVQALGNGVVGVAGMVGGPKCNGTSASGVMSIFEGFSVLTVGLVASHEIGHFLGLEHNTEDNGSHDQIDDTPECPADCSGSSPGGDNLMYWQAVGGDTITDGQGLVIRGHPLLDPAPLSSPKPGFVFSPPAPNEPADTWRLEPNWCGTCWRCRVLESGR